MFVVTWVVYRVGDGGCYSCSKIVVICCGDLGVDRGCHYMAGSWWEGADVRLT